jgi:hypothetical protein
MKLADLIDLEAQLAQDRDAAPAALAARDRALLQAGPADAVPRRRAALLSRWLEALREEAPGRFHPGRTIASALAALRALLALAGLLLGWAAAAAVLRYGGEQPVNVWDVLLVLVGLQLLLLVLLLASLVLPLGSLGAPLIGPLRSALAALLARLTARAGGRAAASADTWRLLWHQLRSRRSLYHRLEPWLLLGLTQTFGVAFNLGALLGCLRVIAFSDVAFGWSSTLLELDAPRFHALVAALAAPWRALWPAAVPSEALVEATRYSRLEAAYLLSGPGRTAHPELVGGWWPFLIAAVTCYGLLPRLATLALARLASARLLATLPLDDAEVHRAVRRLTEPSVETRAETPEPAVEDGSPPVEPAPLEPVTGGACGLVLWRDVPGGAALERAVAQKTLRPIATVRTAGGRDHEEGTVDWGEALDGAEAVVLVAEAFEAPDRGALRLLSQLRRAVGPRRRLLVLLVDGEAGGGPAEAQVRTWRDGVARLADPHLAVEPLLGPA